MCSRIADPGLAKAELKKFDKFGPGAKPIALRWRWSSLWIAVLP